MLQTAKFTTVKIVKGIIPWKSTFCWPCEGRKVNRRGFSASFESDGMTSHKHGLTIAAPEVEFCISFGTNFFRIAGTVEAETSLGKCKCKSNLSWTCTKLSTKGWQTPMLTCCWRRQKNMLFLETFSFKVPVSSSSSDWTGGSSLQLVFWCS